MARKADPTATASESRRKSSPWRCIVCMKLTLANANPMRCRECGSEVPMMPVKYDTSIRLNICEIVLMHDVLRHTLDTAHMSPANRIAVEAFTSRMADKIDRAAITVNRDYGIDEDDGDDEVDGDGDGGHVVDADMFHNTKNLN